MCGQQRGDLDAQNVQFLGPWVAKMVGGKEQIIHPDAPWDINLQKWVRSVLYLSVYIYIYTYIYIYMRNVYSYVPWCWNIPTSASKWGSFVGIRIFQQHGPCIWAMDVLKSYGICHRSALWLGTASCDHMESGHRHYHMLKIFFSFGSVCSQSE